MGSFRGSHLFFFEINTKMTNELNVYQDKKKGKAFE